MEEDRDLIETQRSDTPSISLFNVLSNGSIFILIFVWGHYFIVQGVHTFFSPEACMMELFDLSVLGRLLTIRSLSDKA